MNEYQVPDILNTPQDVPPAWFSPYRDKRTYRLAYINDGKQHTIVTRYGAVLAQSPFYLGEDEEGYLYALTVEEARKTFVTHYGAIIRD